MKNNTENPTKAIIKNKKTEIKNKIKALNKLANNFVKRIKTLDYLEKTLKNFTILEQLWLNEDN